VPPNNTRQNSRAQGECGAIGSRSDRQWRRLTSRARGRLVGGGADVVVALARHSSLVMTCRAPATGWTAGRHETAEEGRRPSRRSTSRSVSDSKTSSGLTLVVRLMMTGFSTWFSIC